MNESPLISVVLPVWNGQQFVSEAIKSVLNQTYLNWELVIVDDSSTDETPRIIETFVQDDSRIKSVRNINNLKLPKSLNVGFEHTNGEYLTWISDDNRLLPTFLECMYEQIKIHGCDFVYSNYLVIDEQGNRVKEAHLGNLDNLAAENCIGAAFLYSSLIPQRIGGYDPTKFMYEDYDYWVRVRLGGFSMRKLEISLYEYRIHTKQLSQTRKLPKEYLMYRQELPERFLQKDIYFDRIKTVRILLFFQLRNRNILTALRTLTYLNLKEIPKFLTLVISDVLRKVFLT